MAEEFWRVHVYAEPGEQLQCCAKHYKVHLTIFLNLIFTLIILSMKSVGVKYWMPHPIVGGLTLLRGNGYFITNAFLSSNWSQTGFPKLLPNLLFLLFLSIFLHTFTNSLFPYIPSFPVPSMSRKNAKNFQLFT